MRRLMLLWCMMVAVVAQAQMVKTGGVTYQLKEQQHGLFTYYLLKKLK